MRLRVCVCVSIQPTACVWFALAATAAASVHASVEFEASPNQET